MSRTNEMMNTGVNSQVEQERVNPFDRAKREWDERIGTVNKHNYFLRVLAFVLLGVVAVLVLVIASLANRSEIEPYIVEVDTNGIPIKVVPMKEAVVTPTQMQVRANLARVIQWTRGVAADPMVIRSNWSNAYHFLAGSATAKMNAYAKDYSPMARSQDETVAVEIISIVPISQASYQARWVEVATTTTGKEFPAETWTGTFTTKFGELESEKSLMINPMSILITDYSWQKEYE